jgi:hypothetical protein
MLHICEFISNPILLGPDPRLEFCRKREKSYSDWIPKAIIKSMQVRGIIRILVFS